MAMATLTPEFTLVPNTCMHIYQTWQLADVTYAKIERRIYTYMSRANAIRLQYHRGLQIASVMNI